MPKKNYNLKPDLTNLFQKAYDSIDELDAPELRKQLNAVWNEILKLLREGAVEQVKSILSILIDFIKSAKKHI